MIQFPRRQNVIFNNTLPIQIFRGTVCTQVHFRVAQRKFAVFTNVGVQTYNVYIVDLLPFLDSGVCFSSFVPTTRTRHRVYLLEVRAKLIFKARIFTQQFPKHTPPDRNNLITSVFDFLQPRLSFLIPVLQSLLGLTNGFVSIWHAKTPMRRAP